MHAIAKNIACISARIRELEKLYARAENSVKLLAVSKQQPSEKIQQAIAAGQRSFGENYLQEALSKMAVIMDSSVEWHFIGRVQRNKAVSIAEHFSWVHSVTSLDIAKRLSHASLNKALSLNICIQVNIDDEPTKAGVLPNKVITLARELVTLPKLRLRGLMAIPKPNKTKKSQYAAFYKVAQLQAELLAAGVELDTLSMGMSADYDMAIKAGSTLVRIGTNIFGQREG